MVYDSDMEYKCAEVENHIHIWTDECDTANEPLQCNEAAVSQLGLDQRLETRHDKTHKMSVRPAQTQISLGIRPV